jgi:hypothetical protein
MASAAPSFGSQHLELTDRQRELLRQAAAAAQEWEQMLNDPNHPGHAEAKAKQEAINADLERRREEAQRLHDELDARCRITGRDLAIVINYGLKD